MKKRGVRDKSLDNWLGQIQKNQKKAKDITVRAHMPNPLPPIPFHSNKKVTSAYMLLTAFQEHSVTEM